MHVNRMHACARVVMVTCCKQRNKNNDNDNSNGAIHYYFQLNLNWLAKNIFQKIKIRMADSANGRYKYIQKIGEGVHGMVLKAQDLTTGKVVAIKKVSLRTKHGEISLSAVREIKALQHCDCMYVSIYLFIID